MGKAVKMLSIEKLTEKYTVNPTRLFEMLKGSKYWRVQKSITKGTLILDIDTEADAYTKSTEQAIQQAKLITKRAKPTVSEVEADNAGKPKVLQKRRPANQHKHLHQNTTQKPRSFSGPPKMSQGKHLLEKLSVV